MMEDTFFEKYWSVLRDVSFASGFVPLARDTAVALTEAHNQAKEIDGIFSFEEVGSLSDAEAAEQRAACSADHIISKSPALTALAQAIQEMAETNGWHLAGTFIRLSSRSPKDAAIYSNGFAAAYVDALHRLVSCEDSSLLGAADQDDLRANQRLRALYSASTAGLRLTGLVGQQAVRLLVLSQRIQDDLAQYVSGAVASDCPFNVVVREFRAFDVQHEFRGFVYGRRLTALTQYNDLVWFPALADPRLGSAIVALIREEFARIVARLPETLQACVVDFVLCRDCDASASPPGTGPIPSAGPGADLAGLKVYIIELNPFAEFAGSGLFDWTRDRALLMGRPTVAAERESFEFRCVSQCPAGHSRVRLDGAWQRFVDLALE